MVARQGFMVEKLSQEKIEALIAQYTALGWQLHSLSDLGSQRLLTFDWPFDSEPPKIK